MERAEAGGATNGRRQWPHHKHREHQREGENSEMKKDQNQKGRRTPIVTTDVENRNRTAMKLQGLGRTDRTAQHQKRGEWGPTPRPKKDGSGLKFKARKQRCRKSRGMKPVVYKWGDWSWTGTVQAPLS